MKPIRRDQVARIHPYKGGQDTTAHELWCCCSEIGLGENEFPEEIPAFIGFGLPFERVSILKNADGVPCRAMYKQKFQSLTLEVRAG